MNLKSWLQQFVCSLNFSNECDLWPKSFVAPWTIIHKTANIRNGCRIFPFTRIMENAVIECNCTIGHNVFIGDGVVIGAGCKIQDNAFIPGGVRIGREVFIGPNVVFTNINNPRAFIKRYPQEARPTTVSVGASIGANATIRCGVYVGEYAMVGCGSVVVNDVAPNTIVVGNPARETGSTIDDDGVINYWGE